MTIQNQNAINKTIYNNYPECKYIEFTSQKAHSDWMDKEIRPNCVVCYQETQLSFKDAQRLKVEGWKRQYMQVETMVEHQFRNADLNTGLKSDQVETVYGKVSMCCDNWDGVF